MQKSIENSPLKGHSVFVMENYSLLSHIERGLGEKHRMIVRGYPLDSAPLFEIEDELARGTEDFLFIHLFSLGDETQLKRLSTAILNAEQSRRNKTVVAKGMLNNSPEYKTEVEKLKGNGLLVITRYFQSANAYSDDIAEALTKLV